MAANIETTPSKDRPSVPHSSNGRKQQVLTKGRASVVRSITDAVVAKDGEPFFLCEPDGQVPVDGRHGYGLGSIELALEVSGGGEDDEIWRDLAIAGLARTRRMVS